MQISPRHSGSVLVLPGAPTFSHQPSDRRGSEETPSEVDITWRFGRVLPSSSPLVWQEQKMSVRAKDQIIAPTSFLWSAYFPKCYYYEIFECTRRLLLTRILVFLVPDTPGQVAFSCIFAIVSLMVFELLRPRVNHFDRQLHRTGCLVILFTNFLALVIESRAADKDSSGSAANSVALVIVNILFFFTIWWNACTTAKAMFSRSHAQTSLTRARSTKCLALR